MAERLKAAVLKIAFRVTGTGVRIPLPPPFSKWLIDFDSNLKSDRITPKSINLRRGAGVADQGRLLSDCLDLCRDRGFESHPLRQYNTFEPLYLSSKSERV